MCGAPVRARGGAVGRRFIVTFLHDVRDMDPSAAELAVINDVASAVAWIGMAPELLQGVREAMGDFSLLREIVLIPAAAWDGAVATIRVERPPPAPAPGDAAPSVAPTPPDRPLRPVELGQVASLRRLARLRLGLPAEEGGGAPSGGAAATAAASQGQPTLPTAGPDGRGRKIKLATVFDQGDDSEIAPWPPARARAVLAAFVAANDGEEPDPEEEATSDQLAALEHRLSTGGAPCPDFGVWRPFGLRLARKLKLTVMHLGPGGEYTPYEVAGPPSHVEWAQAFRVFAMAMRALDAATLPRLELYATRIRKFHETYGPAFWWLIAQADQRMRAEQFDRLRRRAETEHGAATARGDPHPLDPVRPWDLVFKLAAADDKFWGEELVQKCVLFATHLKSQGQLGDPGHGVAQLGGETSGSGGGGRTRRTPRGAKRKREEDHRDDNRNTNQSGAKGSGKAGGKGKGKNKGNPDAKTPDGAFRSSRAGKPICWAWNRERTGCAEPCAGDRAHVCEWCRGGHRGLDCPTRS